MSFTVDYILSMKIQVMKKNKFSNNYYSRLASVKNSFEALVSLSLQQLQCPCLLAYE